MEIFFSVLGATAVFFLLLYVFCICPNICPSRKPIPSELLKNYAHRGLHSDAIPENSLPAFAAAAEAGYGIELDIQLSADGEVMVFHDAALERMTGTSGLLGDMPAASLRTLRLGGTDHGSPTLREVLALVDGRVPLLIELKGESGNTDLCPAADKILSEYSGAYLVESFNPLLLRRYRQIRPEILRGQLTADLTGELGKTARNRLLDSLLLNVLTRPDFLAYDIRTARRFPIRICTGIFRTARFVWTVRSPEDYRLAEKEEACAIFEGFTPPISPK